MRVCVAGLGVNGAACARALALRGADVIAIDPRTPPHAEGSSHGVTRILRFAYFEHPLYVPLVRAAHESWLELERASGVSLFRRVGALNLGPPDGAVLQGVRASVEAHGLPHEILDAREIARRFPDLAPVPSEIGLYETDAGLLSAEPCVLALLASAETAGARLDTGRRAVRRWTEHGSGVRVTTDEGTLDVDVLVLAMGPWLPAHEAGRTLRLTVERQVVFWYEAATVDPARLPITLRELHDGRMIYLAPGPGTRLKAALHHAGTGCDPATMPRTPSADDEARVRPLLRALVPGIVQRAVDGQVCLYTNAADGHFVVDVLPGHERVFVVSACSGHGFKFAPATGTALADLVMEGGGGRDFTPFRATRFAGRPA